MNSSSVGDIERQASTSEFLFVMIGRIKYVILQNNKLRRKSDHEESGAYCHDVSPHLRAPS